MKIKLVANEIKDNYIVNLLKERGIEDIEGFLNPTEKYLEDPSLLKNIDAAAHLLQETLKKQEPKILIVVDSDCDGYTSGSIIYNYLYRVNKNLKLFYSIHHNKEHGLEDQMNLFTSKKYDLVILPDSSSNDYNYHEVLKTLEIPCLVLDHHLADGPFSSNAVIVNNQFEPYKNKDLTGAGVTWQFCRYMDKLLGLELSKDLIDLAALGIIGDMGSLRSLENRFIIYEGLKNVRNPMFRALIDKQAFSIGGHLNPTTVAFYVVPLINAVIRAGAYSEKVQLFEAFIKGDELVESKKRGAKGEMVPLAVECARECSNARTRQNTTKDKAVEKLLFKIKSNFLLDNKILFVRLDDEDNFPSTLNGLIAMQLSSKFHRPTIVARLSDDGYVRGSARGLNDSELSSFKDYLHSTGLFEYTEGHDNAFGASIANDKIYKLHEIANEELKDLNFESNVYNIDFSRLAMDEDVEKLTYELGSKNDLWGSECPEPLLYISDINIKKDELNIMGKNKDTLKFEKNGVTYIKFHAKDLIQDLSQFDVIHLNVVGRAQNNEWMGHVTPQIIIVDYDASNGAYSF